MVCAVRVSIGGFLPVVQGTCPSRSSNKGTPWRLLSRRPHVRSFHVWEGDSRVWGDSGPSGGLARHNAYTKGGRSGGGKAGGSWARRHGSNCQPRDRAAVAVGERDTGFDCCERSSASRGRRQISWECSDLFVIARPEGRRRSRKQLGIKYLDCFPPRPSASRLEASSFAMTLWRAQSEVR